MKFCSVRVRITANRRKLRKVLLLLTNRIPSYRYESESESQSVYEYESQSVYEYEYEYEYVFFDATASTVSDPSDVGSNFATPVVFQRDSGLRHPSHPKRS